METRHKIAENDTLWKEADTFFRGELHTKDINDCNLTGTVKKVNNVIYNILCRNAWDSKK